MSTSSTLYKCSVSQCDFVGSTENSLKAHRVKTHVMRVKVRYSQPDEALLVHRTNGCFNCARCPFKSLYPTVLQVRTFLHITKCNQIMFDFQKHARESCVHKQDPIAPLEHPVIPDSSPIPLQDLCLPSMNPPVHPRWKNSQISATWIKWGDRKSMWSLSCRLCFHWQSGIQDSLLEKSCQHHSQAPAWP